MRSWRRAGGGGGAGGGAGARGGMAAGRGGGAAAGSGGGGGAGGGGLAVSSSAMMRRMEARISSIEGSCAFAGWLIAESLQPPRDAGWNPAPAANHPRTRYLPGSPQVWHGGPRTPTQPCGYAHVRARRGGSSEVIFRRACARRPRCRAPDGSAPSGRRSARRGPAPAATAVPPPPAANRRRRRGRAGR